MSRGTLCPLDAAQIILAIALDNTSHRHKVWNWRPGRSRLTAFADEIAQRPSFATTMQPET
jgi:hypothetical protein